MATDDIDLNLLDALDALLCEASVTGAARRLKLSDSAMSRTLARLRAATGDELLVRAGRAMVPTPHALALRERVRELAHEARSVLQPADAHWSAARLERTFVLRTNDSFIETHAAVLVARAAAEAPHVRLRFAPKPDKDPRPLREGLIDLDIGVLGDTAPELRVQALFRDHFVAAVRVGHPLLLDGPPDIERYAAARHVVTSRRGRSAGPVDAALTEQGRARDIAVVVPTFRAALVIAATTDLVALVPASYLAVQREVALVGFALPLDVPAITVSQLWHPRWDRDPAHRWLRALVRDVCGPAPT